MIHLAGVLPGSLKIKASCGRPYDGKVDDQVKFDDVHRTDRVIDCPDCRTEVVKRLKQKRTDLATNAVHIHNKQLITSELIERYSKPLKSQ